MRQEHISDALNLLREDIIEETAAVRENPKKTPNVRRRYAAAAAAVLLFVCAGAGIFLQRPAEEEGGLPVLELSANTATGAGFEGYLAYDVSELVNANPWSEDTKLSVLPVYRNTLTWDENFIASGADFDRMEAYLLDIAGRMGFEEAQLTVTDDVPDEETQREICEKMDGEVPDGYFAPTKLIAKADGVEISVDVTMTAEISFTPAVSLPAEYHFAYDASYGEMAAVAEYLQTEYAALPGMENAQVNICGGDYNIYGEQSYRIAFFSADGSETEQIVNYNFNQTAFYCDEDGNLFLARMFAPDLSVKVGDYPIITAEEAKKLLEDGRYLSSVPYEMPGEEYVKRVELVYRTGRYETYYMPYYRFYVELPEEKREDGLNTYGAYYVPAVEGRYLSGAPEAMNWQ